MTAKRQPTVRVDRQTFFELVAATRLFSSIEDARDDDYDFLRAFLNELSNNLAVEHNIPPGEVLPDFRLKDDCQ